ncbi:MAG: hypothetical protein L0Z70_07480 [Chloroflexi bacterium]|nr:hypothetical protein [Chloroflexota bacterium]
MAEIITRSCLSIAGGQLSVIGDQGSGLVVAALPASSSNLFQHNGHEGRTKDEWFVVTPDVRAKHPPTVA